MILRFPNLMVWLEKFVSTVFVDKYVDDTRIVVLSRSSSDNLVTPAQQRISAKNIFDRTAQSVDSDLTSIH
jgi:hypothetical protein